MIARRLPQLLRHPFATVFVAVPLGAFLALLAVEALAVFAGLLGMTAVHDILRDVGVNTGPLAFFGGLGAGLSAWWGGCSPFDHEPPPATWSDPHTTTDKYDPVTKKWTYRWETPYERFDDQVSDWLDFVFPDHPDPSRHSGDIHQGEDAGRPPPELPAHAIPRGRSIDNRAGWPGAPHEGDPPTTGLPMT